MFYGYDQGVMSQVNLNPDYQELMGIAPVEGTCSCSFRENVIPNHIAQVIPGTSPHLEVSCLSTTVVL